MTNMHALFTTKHSTLSGVEQQISTKSEDSFLSLRPLVEENPLCHPPCYSIESSRGLFLLLFLPTIHLSVQRAEIAEEAVSWRVWQMRKVTWHMLLLHIQWSPSPSLPLLSPPSPDQPPNSSSYIISFLFQSPHCVCGSPGFSSSIPSFPHFHSGFICWANNNGFLGPTAVQSIIILPPTDRD